MTGQQKGAVLRSCEPLGNSSAEFQIILNSSVGRARVCGWRTVWQGATRPWGHPPQRGATQPDQAGRFMGVELIRDEHPFRLRIGGHGGPQMADKIRHGAGLPHRGVADPAGGHFEVGDQRLRTMAAVFKPLSFRRLAGCHRPGRMEPLQSLNAGLLVGADDMHPLLMELCRLLIELADRSHLFPKPGFVFHLVIQPVAGSRRLEIPLILKNDPRGSRKSAPQGPGGRLLAPVPGASNGFSVPAAFRRPVPTAGRPVPP